VSCSHNGRGSTGGSARNLRKASPASVHTFRSLSRVRSSSDLIRGSTRHDGAVRGRDGHGGGGGDGHLLG